MTRRKNPPQCLPTVSPRFEFNEESGELEQVGIRDDFAFVQSSADTAFSAILKRIGYFDNNSNLELYDPKKVEIVDDVPVTDDLEEVGYTSYADFLEKLQDYAEKRKLKATLTPAEILAVMRAEAEEAKKSLKEIIDNENQKKSEPPSK